MKHRLEDLFLIEEDVKREDEDIEEAGEAGAAASKQSLILHPQVEEVFHLVVSDVSLHCDIIKVTLPTSLSFGNFFPSFIF